ncbi:MAG: SMC-Scp complex subunit ScpB, partial [Pseudomonadota bacterium]
AELMVELRSAERKLSQAAMETLAIIAYHQPVTRAEIEEVRGVAVAKGTLDILLETGWVRLRGRRRVPGRPVTFGTTRAFLEQFSLAAIADLPGLDDLMGAGLLEGTPPAGFSVPLPRDDDALDADEDPLDDEPVDDERFDDAPSDDDPPDDERVSDKRLDDEHLSDDDDDSREGRPDA